MNSFKCRAALLLTLLYVPVIFSATPAGRWTTIDDKTGEKRAVVNLVVKGDTLTGTIVKVFPHAGDKGLCSNCPGEFKDKPIIGLPFMWGVTDKGNGVWENGHILEAQTGKLYHVKLAVKGDELYVRGYIGIPMLGRTQVWVR